MEYHLTGTRSLKIKYILRLSCSWYRLVFSVKEMVGTSPMKFDDQFIEMKHSNFETNSVGYHYFNDFINDTPLVDCVIALLSKQ